LTELDIKRKASELLQKGRYNEAIAEYEALVGQAKRANPAILNLIGDIYIKLGNFEKAFESYLHASRVYADEGLYHNGIAVGKKILRLDKDQVDIFGMLGNLYAKQGLGMDAVKFLTEYARRKEELNEYPAALAAFAEACEILSDFPEVHVAHGGMLERVDRDDDAAMCYESASRAFTDRGMPDRAAKWQARADDLRRGSGVAPTDSHSSPIVSSDDDEGPGMGDLMSLRSLDEKPAKPAKPTKPTKPAKPAPAHGGVDKPSASDSNYWVRPDQPPSLDDMELELDAPAAPTRASSRPTSPSIEREPADAGSDSRNDDPFIVYDPKQAASVPPPPPLPPREPDARRTHDLVLDAMDSSDKETPSAPAKPASAGPSSAADSGLDLTLDFGASQEESLDTLPGIIMPPAARKSSAEIPAPPASAPTLPKSASKDAIELPELSRPASKDAIELPELSRPASKDAIELPELSRPASKDAIEAPEPVAAHHDAPVDATLEETPSLEEFFETTKESNHEQAVVIGDDFELVREGGDVSEVIADFREATMEILDLDDYQAHYDLGTTYMEMELFDEAAAEFEISARGEDFALPSREMLGYCFLRKGQIDVAIRELKRGLEIEGYDDRDKLGLIYNLGIACGVLDQEQAAIVSFQRILEVDPDFRDTKSRLERLVQNSNR
jgi:tetratricopeptide (TPR) repeat protein